MGSVVQFSSAMSPFYELQDDYVVRPVPQDEVFKHPDGFKKDIRRTIIKLTDESHILISTIFLGIDIASLLDRDQPVTFETMVFGGKCDRSCWRYISHDKAVIGHQEVLDSLLDEYQIPSDDPRVEHVRRLI